LHNLHPSIVILTVNTILPKLTILVCLGPYLYKPIGLRLDHLVIFFCVLRISTVVSTISYDQAICAAVLLISVVFCLLSELLAGGGSVTQIAAGLDNYFLFLSAFLVFSQSVSAKNIKTFLFIVAVVMTVNAATAMVTYFVGEINFLRHFHSTTLEGLDLNINSVAYSSFLAGRYTGIFEQPIEAGFAYAIAGLICIFLISKNFNSNVIRFVMLPMIMVGGTLTFSKVFIYGGIPFIFFYSLLINPKSIRLQIIMLGSIIFLSGFLSGPLSEIIERLTLYFDSVVESVLRFRYDSESDVVVTGKKLLLNSGGLFGFGFSGRSIYDNGYWQLLYQGGVFVVVSKLVLMLSIFIKGLTSDDKNAGFLFLFLIILELLVLLGGPTHLANRVSILVALIYAWAFSGWREVSQERRV
jgi:hypothetical protein